MDSFESHVQLFGNHLGQRGAHSGSELGLAAEDRHVSPTVDSDPRIDVVKAVGGLARRGQGKAECDCEDACGGQEVAAGDGHLTPPAARFTALMMRMWVPQRHRLLSSASRI